MDYGFNSESLSPPRDTLVSRNNPAGNHCASIYLLSIILELNFPPQSNSGSKHHIPFHLCGRSAKIQPRTTEFRDISEYKNHRVEKKFCHEVRSAWTRFSYQSPLIQERIRYGFNNQLSGSICLGNSMYVQTLRVIFPKKSVICIKICLKRYLRHQQFFCMDFFHFFISIFNFPF